MNYITVLDGVILSLQPDRAVLSRCGVIARFFQVLICDNLRPDEPPLYIGVNGPRGFDGMGIPGDRPGPRPRPRPPLET